MATVVANVIVGTGTLFYHTTPGTAVGSVTTELGYTEDGVTVAYEVEDVKILVEEATFPIKRVIMEEGYTISCTLAESLLANLENAMAGALTGGAGIVDLGAGAMREMALKFVAATVGGLTCTIYVPYANPGGTVGVSYKKGEKTMIPVEFKAYQGVSGGDVVTITYA